ncbi:Intron-binding protein aquarius [Babesia sp. Xinjiang]|uniref:Intron-binding protein aquarius n=1 Tax=Babesia sp. Xinjiang TaxID=462227 RepID=UPI000A25F7CC|nr:Intron-binding protein aquarius [Babesia sp. Xinjiang]ORM41211.1 Intron-binding protein aquarius [Babesia sp. Xinjiang]
MVFERRSTAKRSHFSCKKLSFLELQRYRRLEYGRWLTRRKRAERVCFLPSVKDEVGALSAESMQRILHQGSAFHFSKDIVIDRSKTLHHLLFDDFLNVRRLTQHELLLLVSVLPKLSAPNHNLLSRALHQCVSRFDRFSFAEVAHFSFLICHLPECLKIHFSRQWLPKVANLLHRLDPNDFGGSDFISLAKLAYALSHLSPGSNSLAAALISTLPTCDGDNPRMFSRDCSLVCRSMLASGTVNYRFLSHASEIYTRQVDQAVLYFVDRLHRRSALGRSSIVFTLDDAPAETLVAIDDLLLFLSTCERFGYHNKALLSTFHRYVEYCTSLFLSDSRAAEYYRNYGGASPDKFTRKFAELVRSDRYRHPRSGKHNLEQLLKELLAGMVSDPDGFWPIESIYIVGSNYVTHRSEFAKFLDFVLCKVNYEVLSYDDKSRLLTLCRLYHPFHPKLLRHMAALAVKDAARPVVPSVGGNREDVADTTSDEKGNEIFLDVISFRHHYASYTTEGNGKDLHKLIVLFPRLAAHLPEIICWDCVWQMLHVIARSHCAEMLPLVRSFLEESFLGFHPLDEATGDITQIIIHLLKQGKSFNESGLYLDSCVRIVDLLSSADLSRDYGSLYIFGNFFELFVTVRRFLKLAMAHDDDDTRLTLERLSSCLERYLESLSFNKQGLLSLEVPLSVYVQILTSLSSHFGVDLTADATSAERSLELLRVHCAGEGATFLRSSAALIRHILFQAMAPAAVGTLFDIERSDLFRLLQRPLSSDREGSRRFRTPEDVLSSPMGDLICKAYSTLFRNQFSHMDLSALEHSGYVFLLWPLLSLDGFPLIPNLKDKSRNRFCAIRFSAVMTCIWAVVEDHNSGRSEYSDLLRQVAKEHPQAFDCVFYNAAQLLMLESWHGDLCDSRDLGSCDRLTILEQRALVRFFILCFQRFEVGSIRRCCVQLVSPAIWLHIPSAVRERNIYPHNRVAKGLFMRATSVLEGRYEGLDHVSGLPDFSSLPSVVSLYELSSETLEAHAKLNERARLLLSRDFLNSLLNQFVYVLEDGINLESFSSTDAAEQSRVMQRLMLCENQMELVIDLLSQLNTRRIVKPLFDAKLILVRCQQTPLHDHLEGSLFKSMLRILDFYANFYIDEELGTPLDYDKMLEQYYDRFESFQRVCFTKFGDDPILKSVHLLSAFEVHQQGGLTDLLSQCKSSVLGRLVLELGLFAMDDADKDASCLLRPAPINLTPIKEKGKSAVKKFLVGVINASLQRQVDSLEFLNSLPLYPTEELLWSSSQLPVGGDYVRLSSFGLHKLNLQYLTLFDYLYRNFTLYRLESASQIKSDLEEAIDSCCPRGYISRHNTKAGQSGMVETLFEGSHPMAIEISSFSIREVSSATVLRSDSSFVDAEIVIDTSSVKEFQVRRDWQRLKRHDVLFLAAISAPLQHVPKRLDDYESPEEVPLNLGINLVRGAEICQVLDEDGHVISDLNPYETRTPIGFRLILRVRLDYNQYIEDIARDPNIYASMNLLVRRHSRVNNFKSVLVSLRHMINSPTTLPGWLGDIFLGFGDPNQCQYPTLEPSEWKLNFLDTWKNLDHFFHTANGFLLKVVLLEGHDTKWPTQDIAESTLSVQNLDVTLLKDDHVEALSSRILGDGDLWSKLVTPGVSVDTSSIEGIGGNRYMLATSSGSAVVEVDLVMLSEFIEKGVMVHGQRGDLQVPPKVAVLIPRFNLSDESVTPSEERPSIVFTPSQVESIRSGVSRGLTMIVGPPGTGKTDCVCQVVGILFRNLPAERTVICTHSNYALNDIFTKLVLNGHVDEHHIVRLGGAEFEIEGLGDFSKWGRVNFILQRRLDLLDVVKSLVDALAVPGDYNFSLQLAISFFESKILPLLRSSAVATQQEAVDDAEQTKFASNDSVNVPPESSETTDRFSGSGMRRLVLLGKFFECKLNFASTLRDLATRWHFLQLSHSSGDLSISVSRREFLLYLYAMIKELQPFEVLRNNHDRGRYLVEKYARLVAMTCTHAAIARETLSSLRYSNLVMEEAAQVLEAETFALLAHPLKRVILSGDHYQLPPVVNNRILQQFSNMQQSLFHRLVRLETPHVMLNCQGRCRPEIANLFTHFYPIPISNIDIALSRPEFSSTNPCFEHTVQFVDCTGRESAPIAHYYQNLEEAEFVVATYMYMRLCGYSNDKIVILCAYNGQKALVDDIVKHKCAWNPRIKAPRAVATIDKFQGRQSDFVLLSLVRSTRPGHLGDPRRMLVALSRARLGLYIFGNWRLFSGCRQLKTFASRLEGIPHELRLLPSGDAASAVSVSSSGAMAAIVEGLQS